ncbi:DUF4190 domain-containing protein [Cellulosimicrobium sp. Marseille-Q8652]
MTQPPVSGPPEGERPPASPYPGAAPNPVAAPNPGAAPYPGPAPYGSGPYPPVLPQNGLAVWSLVLGIASFVLSCGFLTGIPAIVLGTQARRAVASGQADNGGLATAGIVLGWISVALSVVAIALAAVLFPALLVWVGSIPDQQ